MNVESLIIPQDTGRWHFEREDSTTRWSPIEQPVQEGMDREKIFGKSYALYLGAGNDPEKAHVYWTEREVTKEWSLLIVEGPAKLNLYPMEAKCN